MAASDHITRTRSVWRGALLATVAGALAVGLGSCAPAPVHEDLTATIPERPADFPDDDYRRAGAAGHRVLRIDAKQSLIAIDVRRDGILARLGHDHAVSSHDVNGYVDLDEGRADLVLPLAKLAVDEPERRAEAGFSPQPDEDAIAGTRRNMLTRVLDAGNFPFARITVRREAADDAALQVAITLHGVTRQFVLPVQIESQPDGLTVTGALSFRQSDFGIVPMSALNGALLVADRLDLRFRIVARRS